MEVSLEPFNYMETERKNSNLSESFKYFIKQLKFCYKDNKVIFLKYLSYSLGRAISYPIRKLSSDPEKGDARYRNFIKDKKEVTLNILGNRMILPTADHGLTRDLIIEGIREKNSVRAFFKEYKP